MSTGLANFTVKTKRESEDKSRGVEQRHGDTGTENEHV